LAWPDAVIRGLRAHGIAPVVTIWGTPAWANGGSGPSSAPRSSSLLGAFAGVAARRYRGQVADWVIWNEPNQVRWLRPASVKTYTQLLNV
jgi:beta-glucosidase/6-phospho-beta-glucosidase/beta-galactosidase